MVESPSQDHNVKLAVGNKSCKWAEIVTDQNADFYRFLITYDELGQSNLIKLDNAEYQFTFSYSKSFQGKLYNHVNFIWKLGTRLKTFVPSPCCFAYRNNFHHNMLTIRLVRSIIKLNYSAWPKANVFMWSEPK